MCPLTSHGHLCSFHIFAAMSDAATNIHMQVFLWVLYCLEVYYFLELPW